jgi:NADH:ubiquinone oxidoreductase subunit F (NADH-binding)/Pyruvate/2-oxoacid:ferredoxin oxidoreductase delta subunit
MLGRAINGLFARPSIVNNVETLANVPSIINEGPDWFCRIGTSTSKGTKVFALSGKTRFTGLVEIPMGTSLRQIIYDIAGGIPDGKSFKAAQIGGPTGGCIAEENLDVQIDYDSLKKLGTMMGSGGLVVMDESSCMVDLCRYFLQFIHRESCGKCIPCREGTHRMFEILESITRKPKQENGYETLERFKGIMQLENLAEVIRDTSLCGLGKTAPTPVLTSLKYFREEFEEHIFERKCQAGVCRELRTFIIEIDKCTGCTLCARKCPTGAIIGSIRNPHFIVSEKCTGCGICYEICKFNAVIQK